YGAGWHTRAIAPVLDEGIVEVVCVIDDDAGVRGSRIAGREVVSLDRAMGMGLDAVMLSSTNYEMELWARSEPLRRAGVRVEALYSPGAWEAALLDVATPGRR
ncbi:MAG: hypothetical protein ACREJO_12855, partial [Phycisphaerales bacterium]